MNDNKFDKLMTAYCDPEVEGFEFKKKKNTGAKKISVVAAALIMVLLGTLIIPALSGSKHSFVLTVNAASDRLRDEDIGNVYAENSVYDKDMNFIERYYVMSAEMAIDGDDIDDVSFRSVNGYGRFYVSHDPDPDDYHDDSVWTCDPDGDPDPFYSGWRTYDFNEYYVTSNIDTTNDWSKYCQYRIVYNAVDDNDLYLQPDKVTEDRNDIIEITVTFTDGDTLTKRLGVTYPDGIMTVKEITG